MAYIIALDVNSSFSSQITQAVYILKKGGIVAYPTETIYGLACDSLNEKAVEKIFIVKGRNERMPIPIIVSDESQLSLMVKTIPPGARKLAGRFWPGGVTIVFEASSVVPVSLTGGTGKIGIRISSNPVASLLARQLGSPITATSANRSGRPECITAAEVNESIGGRIDAIIDGGRTPGPPGTTVVDATVSPPLVLREGKISGKLILKAFTE
ncbi:MAG: L-threonylcarbamoyladenylate synthase [Syntrophales bacterium]|jgi:L-threonylcarbamoyladenylate synthase|nr:L-threonylcarbamoyladenylate synthase [Syntrophales bacterium]MDY0043630.1 L-threonylcarbamoyladenylate synthase [Syntrophales bacterium]